MNRKHEEMIYWIDILLAYREGKFGRYYHGLTPRLIVGASQVPMGKVFENDKIAHDVTKQIFEEMRQYYENNLIVSSNHCDIHDGPVMQFTEAKWTNDSIGTSFDIVWNRYGDEIISGNFGISPYDQKILNKIF